MSREEIVMHARYGYTYVRPQMMLSIISDPKPTFSEIMNGWLDVLAYKLCRLEDAAVVILGVLLVALPLSVAAPSVSGMIGIAAGLAGFAIWVGMRE